MSKTPAPELNKKNLVVIGITGRMGLEIMQLASDSGWSVSAGVGRRTMQPGLETGRHATPAPVVVANIADLDPVMCDAVVDFSLPHLTVDVAAWCAQHCKPLVSGVTGLSGVEKQALNDASRVAPVLWSPNMSLGVAVLMQAMQALSALEGFDFQIEETHHIGKKDKPSGTALLLQESLSKAVPRELPPPISIRGGGVFGIHRVLAMGAEETITFEHSAMNRRVFARGALRAVEWLSTQPSGLYTMQDLLAWPVR